jgi:probable HAF family extracellular repeat protein
MTPSRLLSSDARPARRTPAAPPRTLRLSRLAGALTVAVAATASAGSPGRYQFTLLDQGAKIVTPTSIDDNGTIVGSIQMQPKQIKCFARLSDGSFKYWAPFGFQSTANAIDGSFAVGRAHGPSGTRYLGEHAFVTHSNGKTIDLFPTQPLLSYSVAFGVNAAGTVVGTSDDNDGHARQAYTWNDQVLTWLGTLPGGPTSTAYAVNETGVVVGTSDSDTSGHYHAFSYDTQMNDLGTLPSGLYSQALAINASGIITGWSDNADGIQHAVTWEPGRTRDLSTLEPTNPNAWSSGTAISSLGQVVGQGSVGTSVHAWVRLNGPLRDLNTLTDGLPDGMVLRSATGVNTAGVIVGTAMDTMGVSHGYMLTPE